MRLSFVLLTSLASLVGATSLALGGDSSVGLSVTSDRQEDDLSVPQSTKLEVNASHTFDSGVTLGGSIEYSNTAFSDSATVNFETTLGYRLHFDEMVSVTGSVGVGERVQVSGTGDDVPYYVLRAGADLKLNHKVTWHAVAFRYRDGFDAADNYLTPQLATGFALKLDEHNSVSTKVQYNWKDWNPDTIGLDVSYSHSF